MATSVIGNLRVNLGLDTAALQAGMKQASASLRGMGDSMKSVGKSMSLALTAPLAGFGALTLRTAGNFEASMNRVQAATGASKKEFDALRKAALDMGKTTQFSASESADAIEVLAKNGLGAADILGGALEASMLLAASAGADLASAGDVATDVMMQFGKQAGDLTGLVDGMNGVMLASKFSFDDYRLALGQAGGVAGALGVEFEDFNAAIAGTSSLFASGSDAGTSFKTFLQRLVPASGPAAEKIKELGLEFFDAQGNMKSMAEIAQELQDGLSGLSEEAKNDAVSTIFGNDGLRTAVGLADLGAEGIERLKKVIGDVSAEEQAAARMKGWEGEIKKLKSAFEALQLAIADAGLIQFATDMVRHLTEFVAKLSEANPQMLRWGVILGAVAAAIGPVLIGLGALLAGIGPIVSGIGLLVAAAGAISAPFAAAAAAVAAAAVLIVQNWEAVGPWFRNLFSSIGNVFMGLAKTLAGIVNGDMSLAVEGLKQAWSGLQAFFQTLWDGVVAVFTAAWEKIKSIVDKIRAAVLAVIRLRDRLTHVGEGGVGDGSIPVRKGPDRVGDLPMPIAPPVYTDDLRTGLADGTSDIGAQGTTDGDDYDKNFRNRMGINSPSRVMMEVGQYLTEGLQQGILAGESDVDQASYRVGETAVSRFLSHFDNIAANAESLGDVWENMKSAFLNAINDMANGLLNSGLSSLFGGLFGAIDPLAGALRGAGLPAIPGYANGVNNFGGGWATINERGGELVKLPGGSTVVPHDLSRQMLKGSRQDEGGHISIGFDQTTGSLTATMRNIAGNVVSQAMSASNRALPSRVAEINRDPLKRSS